MRILSAVVLAVAVAAAGVTNHRALAESTDFPQRPVTVITPYAPGGTDIGIRAITPVLSRILGQRFLVVNRPGGGGSIGMMAVKSAPTDGYTLVFISTPVLSILPHVNPVDFKADDFVSIGNITAIPLVLVARANAPYKTFKELVEYAKANPGVVNFASGGTGTATHILGEILQFRAGVKFKHIPYSGAGPAVQGLITDQVDLLIAGPDTFTGLLQDGKLRALVALGDKRFKSMPDVPTALEAGYDVNVVPKGSLMAPRGTPQPIVDLLAKALEKAMADDEFVNSPAIKNLQVMHLTAPQLDAAIKSEVGLFDKVFADPKFKQQLTN